MLLCVAVVALTVAAAGGCLAAARRTSSAFDRFVAWSDPPDVSIGGAGEDKAEALRAALASAPEIERFDYLYTIAASVVLEDGAALTFDQAAPLILGSPTVGGRLKVIDGRLPDEASSDELVVTAVTAERLGLGPGDEVSLTTDDGVVPMRVAAVVAAASEFPTVGGRTLSFLAAMPGFLEAHPDLVAPYDSTAAVWLRDGTEGLPAFRAQGDELGFGSLDLDDQAEVTMGVNRILGTDAVALMIAGLLAAVVGTAILHQLLRREADSVAGDLRTLGTLGVTRAGRAGGGALAGGFIGGVGAVAGVAGAVASSWFTPFGVARLAEPDLGLAVDATVLLVCLAVAVAVAGLLGAWCVVRAGRKVRVGRSTTIRGIPEPAATGVRFALAPEGGGVGGRARMGLAGLAVTVALLVAVAVIGGTLSRVQGRPELSGGWWDGFVGVWDERGVPDLEEALASTPGVARTARAGWLGESELAGRPLGMMFTDPEGEVAPVMSRGRAPLGPHEVALGPATLAASGHDVGDDVTLEIPSDDGSATSTVVRVVGETVMVAPLWFTMAPGEGALVTTDFVERWEPTALEGAPTLIEVADGVDVQDVLADLRASSGLGPDEIITFARSPRGDIEALSGLTRVPVALAVVLVVLAGVTFVHLVVVSARRHRREQAILRSLGFTPRQARLSSTMHSGALAAVTLLVGVPLGLWMGSRAWRTISSELTVTPRLLPPTGLLAGGTVVALAAALVLGGTVGARRWRDRPAALLRSE